MSLNKRHNRLGLCRPRTLAHRLSVLALRWQRKARRARQAGKKAA